MKPVQDNTLEHPGHSVDGGEGIIGRKDIHHESLRPMSTLGEKRIFANTLEDYLTQTADNNKTNHSKMRAQVHEIRQDHIDREFLPTLARYLGLKTTDYQKVKSYLVILPFVTTEEEIRMAYHTAETFYNPLITSPPPEVLQSMERTWNEQQRVKKLYDTKTKKVLVKGTVKKYMNTKVFIGFHYQQIKRILQVTNDQELEEVLETNYARMSLQKDEIIMSGGYKTFELGKESEVALQGHVDRFNQLQRDKKEHLEQIAYTFQIQSSKSLESTIDKRLQLESPKLYRKAS